MRFDRLRLCGFKSFVEPVDIEIKPGLTGIVGPNGCGKSNLVEGLRWLMGANSAKAMRASGMDEVIFAGTAGGRAARSWAEVTLEIDNSERRAPAQFNDTDTLVVARRVVRRADGSISNYSINGKEVRARDVQMLFADASTGSTSPALVRQGQISELINAKPTERRRFLEEAAGVTGLAARRHEAQLRLKAAGDNLERLDDVIGELDVQSEQLSRQARKAAKYKALTDEIKDAERDLTAARIGAAFKAHQRLETQISERRNLVAEAASTAASADREATSSLKLVDDARTEERKKATAMTKANADLKSFESEQALRQQAAAERERALEKLSGDETREMSLLEEAKTAITAAAERIAALNGELGSEADARAALEEAARAADEAAQDAEQAFEETQARAAELKAEIRAAEEAKRLAQTQLESAQTKLRAVEAQWAELPALDDTVLNQATRDVEAAATERTNAEERLAAAEGAREETRTLSEQAVSEHRRLSEACALLEKERAVLLPLLPKADNETSASLMQTLSAPENVRSALAAALGDALYAALGTGDHAWTDHGAPNNALAPLPAGTQPLDGLLDTPPALARRFQSLGLVEDVPTNEQLAALTPGQTLLNSRGDLWRWDGYKRLGESQGHLEELLAAAARLKELDTAIAAAQRDAARASDHADQAKAAAEQAAAAHKAAREALSNAAAEERRTAQALETIKDQQSGLRAKRETIDAQRTNLRDTVLQAEENLKSAEARAPAQHIDDMELARLRAQRDEARRRAGQARGQAAEHRRQVQARRDNLRQQQAQERAWTERRRAADQRISELSTQRQELEAQIAEATPVGDHAQTGEALELAASEAERAWERARDALAEQENKSSAAEKTRREAEASVAAIREDLAALNAELKAALERLDEALAETEMSRDAAASVVAQSDALGSVDALQNKLTRLERERERLGSVNLLAADEQTQVEERLESLRRERSDCEDASAQLQTAVNSINREGRQRLLAAFDAVNGHFRELFTSLFGGGEAHLKFVDNDDPLAAGLEIFACPPGKKLQSLSLMSGGEQALTATALIFAAFKTNPAPICVLDEVDAPLDDANVERFCDLLSLMARSATTRFVVVTHHPLTMSRMDRLFGVTMMERGVSRLFSLDLDSARRLAA
ncbi:MAG: chromosome segregation protein SMC [Pseudomonadota bacterium]